MLDGRSFLAFPVETADRVCRPCLSGESRLRNSGRLPRLGFSPWKSLPPAMGWDAPFAIVSLMNVLDMVCEIAHAVWMFRFEC
jgi:hypothetical protein